MPEEGAALSYTPETGDEHLVALWANVPIGAVFNMQIDEYLRYRRDAFIDNMNQTEEGRAALDKARTFEQVKPDREAARAFFG